MLTLKIAIVEDHDALREVMSTLLQSQGHQVVGFASAESFDQAMVAGAFDLLVADLNLPGADGFSAVRCFRGVHPLGSVIMVSARDGLTDKVTGYEAGADLYLTKPLAPVELMAAVGRVAQRLMSKGPTDRENEERQPLRLDTRTLTLEGPQATVSVTNAEATILTALARAPGQTLEVWQILELLGIDLGSSSKANFEVRMVRLRKKLAATGAAKPALKVIRMGGYRVCVPIHVY